MILALDPSIANTGWCVVRPAATISVALRSVAGLYVESGMIYTEASSPVAERCAYLAEQVGRVLDRLPITLALVEFPSYAGVYAKRGRYASGAAKSGAARESILGTDLAMMHRATGAILAALGGRVRVQEVHPPPRPNKAERAALVKSYWPDLVGRPLDETDAAYYALKGATDARRTREAAA